MQSLLTVLKNDANAHSRCLRRICAARLGDVVAYNGPGIGICTGHKGNCGCMHAEARLLMMLFKTPPTSRTLLTTLSPCLACAHLVVESGLVDRCVYLREYRDYRGIQLLRSHNIEVSRVRMC